MCYLISDRHESFSRPSTTLRPSTRHSPHPLRQRFCLTCLSSRLDPLVNHLRFDALVLDLQRTAKTNAPGRLWLFSSNLVNAVDETKYYLKKYYLAEEVLSGDVPLLAWRSTIWLRQSRRFNTTSEYSMPFASPVHRRRRASHQKLPFLFRLRCKYCTVGGFGNNPVLYCTVGGFGTVLYCG